MAGDALIARVYNAVRANDALWRSMLLIVLFDEHGGYYDHVEPPAAPTPDGCTLEYAFDRLGVRVPAVLVSPWVRAGVFPDDKGIHFDHTSLGKYLCNKWGLSPLGSRMQQANSIEGVLRLALHHALMPYRKFQPCQPVMLSRSSRPAKIRSRSTCSRDTSIS